jgi:D-amino-acid dehydrogenase
VTVIDRQATPGAETSFANGGQISVSHAEPWANPSAPLKVLQWLGKEDAPLLFRMRADMRQWLWGLQFLRECTPARTRHNIRQIVRLGTYSRDVLQQLRRDTGMQYDQRTQGILHFYTEPKEFDGAGRPGRADARAGLRAPVISAPTRPCARAGAAPHPPAAGRRHLHGRGRIGRRQPFARELAKLCEAAGVQFLMSHTSPRCAKPAADRPCGADRHAEGRFQRMQGDAYVLAMGSFSPLLAAAAGHPPAHLPGQGLFGDDAGEGRAPMAHQVSLTDDEFKLVFSRYTERAAGDRLRIAGTAELNGYDRDLNRVRCEAIVRRVEQLFPGAGDQPGAVLDRPAPGHAQQRAHDRPDQAAQPVPQHRPRHAGLDAFLRLGQGARPTS